MGLGRWTTGSAVGTGGQNGLRLAWRIDQSPSSVGSGTSSVSLRLRIRAETRRSVYDSSNSFNLSGDWPSRSGQSRNISHSSSTSWSSQNRTIIYDERITVSTSYTGTRTRSFSASFSGINAAPGTARVSGSRTVPRRPVNVPNTPSNVSASRNSDTSHRITWSQSTSSARPVTGFRIQRSTYTSSGWSGWVTRTSNVSSGSRAWTDTGTRNNRAYQWRVIAVNAAGTRASSSTGTLWTTPWNPTNVTAQRISGDNIRVRWRTSVPYGAHGFTIQRQENGGSWGNTVNVSGGSYDTYLTWTHQNPNLASTHRYRIRSRTTSGPTYTSDWVYSDVIQLAAPPNAPTITGPTVAVDAQGNPVRLTWLHNPVDGSEQDSYQIRWRYEYGGPHEWNTLPREYSDTQAHTFPAGFFDNNQVVQVQVRTWGAHNDPGPYSSQFTFRASDPPTVAINYPDPADPEHHEAHITAQWGYGGNVGQSHWEAELIRPVPDDPEAEGTLIERRTGTGTASSVRFNRRLPDQTEWRVRVRVRAGDGLWSIWDQVDFTVSYPLPAVPEGGGAWDVDQGAVTVDVDEGVTEEGQEPTALVQLYRPGQAFFEGPAQEISAARAAAEEYGLPEGFYAENLVTNPRGRRTDGVVTVRENLIGNPSFETSLTGLLSGPGTNPPQRVQAPSAAGEFVAEFEVEGAASNTGWVMQELELPSGTEGQYLAFSTMVRRDAGSTEAVRLRAWGRDADGESLPIQTLTDYIPLTSNLERLAGVFQIQPEAVMYRLYLWSYGGAGEAPADGTLQTDAWIACVADTEAEALAAVAGYFDGDTWEGDPDLSPQWEGEPHESPSRLIAPVPVGWEGSGLYYSEVNDAVAIPASAERQALLDAIQNYTDDPVQWSTTAPADTSVVWVDPGTGQARAWSAGVGGSVDDVVTRNLVTNPRGRDTSGTVTVGRNLIQNPSFETGRHGWVTVGGVMARSSGYSNLGYRVGEYVSVSQASGSSPTLAIETDSDARVPVTSGQWVAVSAWVSPNSSAGAVFRLQMNGYDAEGGPAGGSFSSGWRLITYPEGARLTVVAQVPEGAVEMNLRAEMTTEDGHPFDTNARLFTDGWIACEANTEAEALAAVEHYFDGDTTYDLDFTPEWEGEPHESPSRLVAPAPVGWFAGIGGVVYYSASRDMIALRVTGEVQAVSTFTDDVPPEGTATAVAMVEGAPGDEVRVFAGFPSYETVVLTDIVQEVRATVNSIQWQSGFALGGNPEVGATVYFRMLATAGEYDGPYFDGDTPERRADNIIYRYAWDDEPHASPSTETALGQGWHDIIDPDVVAAGQAYAASFARPPHESVQGTLAVQDVLADSTSYHPVDEQAYFLPSDQHRYVRVAVVEGEYTGPVFDGHSEQEGVIFEWTGDEDESTSTAYLEWEALLEEYFEQHAVPIGPPVEPGTSITDYIPPLNEVVPYRVEALTELGASQVSEIFLVETSPTGGWIHLNAGPGFSEHIRLKYNPGFSRAPERAKATHHFAGREEEVEIAGESRTTTGTITTSALTLEGIYTEKEAQATPREIEAFADFPAPVCKRVPEVVASREFVSLGTPTIDHGTVEASVSIPWRKVHYDE